VPFIIEFKDEDVLETKSEYFKQRPLTFADMDRTMPPQGVDHFQTNKNGPESRFGLKKSRRYL
jgi:hypothetical protein